MVDRCSISVAMRNATVVSSRFPPIFSYRPVRVNRSPVSTAPLWCSEASVNAGVSRGTPAPMRSRHLGRPAHHRPRGGEEGEGGRCAPAVSCRSVGSKLGSANGLHPPPRSGSSELRSTTGPCVCAGRSKGGRPAPPAPEPYRVDGSATAPARGAGCAPRHAPFSSPRDTLYPMNTSFVAHRVAPATPGQHHAGRQLRPAPRVPGMRGRRRPYGNATVIRRIHQPMDTQ